VLGEELLESTLREGLLSLKAGIFSPGEAFSTDTADSSQGRGGLLILAGGVFVQ